VLLDFLFRQEHSPARSLHRFLSSVLPLRVGGLVFLFLDCLTRRAAYPTDLCLWSLASLG
jgi:hypothetical protein